MLLGPFRALDHFAAGGARGNSVDWPPPFLYYGDSFRFFEKLIRRTVMAERIALVLDGGGFNGAKAVGIAKSLWKRGKIPGKIQGVSVGALNAAKLVESGADGLEADWMRMAGRHHHEIFQLDWHQIILHPMAWWDSNSVFTDKGLLQLLGQ